MVMTAPIAPQSVLYEPWKKSNPSGSVFMFSSEIRMYARVNSFQLFKNWKMAIVAIAGSASGRMTPRNNR
ncbi:hypothetical protein D3C75_650950 [compost metagenome]